jgi:hypothetical protein
MLNTHWGALLDAALPHVPYVHTCWMLTTLSQPFSQSLIHPHIGMHLLDAQHPQGALLDAALPHVPWKPSEEVRASPDAKPAAGTAASAFSMTSGERNVW